MLTIILKALWVLFGRRKYRLNFKESAPSPVKMRSFGSFFEQLETPTLRKFLKQHYYGVAFKFPICDHQFIDVKQEASWCWPVNLMRIEVPYFVNTRSES